jgi:hypothetical protein
VPLVVCSVCAALDDFVDTFPVQVKANQAIVCVVFQDSGGNSGSNLNTGAIRGHAGAIRGQI